MEIPFYYDPMIAKLVVCADSRSDAIRKMIRAIDEYEITGIQTTLGFCRFVMNHEAFRSGQFDTRFVELYFDPEKLVEPQDENEQVISALLSISLLDSFKSSVTESLYVTPSAGKWKRNRL